MSGDVMSDYVLSGDVMSGDVMSGDAGDHDLLGKGCYWESTSAVICGSSDY